MLVALKIHSGAFRWNVEGLLPLEGFGESECNVPGFDPICMMYIL